MYRPLTGNVIRVQASHSATVPVTTIERGATRRTFAPDPAGEAVIVRRYFRGSENLYCLGLPSGERVHSSQPSSAAYPNGLRVRPVAHVLHVVTFPATP
jgi:hypothetical protein